MNTEPTIAIVPLNHGCVAWVDVEDYERVLQFKWSISGQKEGLLYAWLTDGRSLSMHRFILDLESRIGIDHKNNNGLDNRKTNLRTATQSQNNANRRKQKGYTSQYKGVSKSYPSTKWRAQIRINGKPMKLGYFAIEKDAAEAYDRAALELFGEFAVINFP